MAIVQRLRIHPDVLEGLLARWARLRKGFFIDGTQATAILRMLGIDSEPKTAGDFAAAVRTFANRYLRCHDCKRAWPMYCRRCTERRGSFNAVTNEIDPTRARGSDARVSMSASNGATEREDAPSATVVFIRTPSFSEEGERMTKADCMQLLVDFSAATARIAGMNGAVVDDEGADAIAVVFRSHSRDEHARRAVHVALEMRSALQKLNDRLREQGLPLVNIVIAIDTFAGGVTGDNGVSDVVRNAGRCLTKAIRRYGAGLFATERTMSLIAHEFETQRRDETTVEGHSNPVVIYELLGRARDTETTAAV